MCSKSAEPYFFTMGTVPGTVRELYGNCTGTVRELGRPDRPTAICLPANTWRAQRASSTTQRSHAQRSPPPLGPHLSRFAARRAEAPGRAAELGERGLCCEAPSVLGHLPAPARRYSTRGTGVVESGGHRGADVAGESITPPPAQGQLMDKILHMASGDYTTYPRTASPPTPQL